jgi:tetratricopeptide (TPR) repeat protein
MMKDDESLRQAFQALSKDAAFTASCPAADKLWAGARGELPAGEVEALAVHMAECGACAEAWRVARDFGERAVLQAPAKAFPWWLAAAAAVTLIAGASALVYLRQDTSQPAPVTAARAPAPPIPFAVEVTKAPIMVSSRYALTWRGPNDGPRFLAALKEALGPYERSDYEAAVPALRPLVERYPDTFEPHFYLGVSWLLSSDAAAAVQPLERARTLADAAQTEASAWYLAAAYERTTRYAQAQQILDVICKGTGPRSTAACTAANALRNRP